MAEGVVNKNLANSATGGEAKYGVANRRIAPDKGRRGGEFIGGGGGKADDWGKRSGYEVG